VQSRPSSRQKTSKWTFSQRTSSRPGVDAADLERRLDEREELEAVLLRAIEEVQLLLARQVGIADHLEIAEHHVQRRAELVRDRRHELGADAARRLQLVVEPGVRERDGRHLRHPARDLQSRVSRERARVRVLEAERQHAEQRLVAAHGDEERVRMVARAGEARQVQLGRVSGDDVVADELVAEHLVDVCGERRAVQVRRHPRGRRRRDDPERERSRVEERERDGVGAREALAEVGHEADQLRQRERAVQEAARVDQELALVGERRDALALVVRRAPVPVEHVRAHDRRRHRENEAQAHVVEPRPAEDR
jgi:hypothetical protein